MGFEPESESTYAGLKGLGRPWAGAILGAETLGAKTRALSPNSMLELGGFLALGSSLPSPLTLGLCIRMLYGFKLSQSQ